MVPELSGDGVTNRQPGSAESHNYDPEPEPAANLHCGPFQGFLPGNHPNRQPEEVSTAHPVGVASTKTDLPLLTKPLCLSRLFFRRHYSVNTVIFCALDPQDRK